MKQLTDIKVSWYENKFSRKSVEMSLYEVLNDIAKGKYATKVNIIRRYWAEGDKEAAQRLKGDLPAVTMSGTFKGGHSISNLIKHNRVLVLDFDDVEDRERLEQQCREDPHTMFSFGSPTSGYKLGIYVEGAEKDHRRAWQLVSEYYQKLTGLECDEACKDPSRLCYMSYDPGIYVAPFYESFVLPEESEEVISEADWKGNNSPCQTDDSSIGEFVKSWIFLNPRGKGKRNASLYKMACEACKRGYSESAICSELIRQLEEKDFPASEIRRTILSGYKRFERESRLSENGSFGSGHDAKVPKCQYNDDKNEPGEEERYWEGEELRRNTPCFSEKVYENIPAMLGDCIPGNLSVREKDLLLLSLLTAYSAILPNTVGTYNRKRYSPHLFTLGIAPAGSGKSIAQLARRLLKVIELQVFHASELEFRNYEVRKMEWQVECAQKIKKKEKFDMRHSPEEPPFKMLIMPADTSHARMHIQIRDNGEMGGIILDTEAQTLTNANQMDCGHLDDMLCKAFEHETISSSFKANGKRPIVVNRPLLALLLTGTPEQFYKLIQTPENGLFSRNLIYTYREETIWKKLGGEEEDWDDMYEIHAHNASLLYQFCQTHPMVFNFTLSQWKRLNHDFSILLSEVVVEGNDHLQAIVKRHGFMVMRIAMILTRLRQFDEKERSVSFYCSDIDFDTALTIVKCCYEHSRLILTSMPSGYVHVLKDPDNKRRFWEELPEVFTTQEAIEMGANHSISERSVKRMLLMLRGKKINKLAHGKYEKIK